MQQNSNINSTQAAIPAPITRNARIGTRVEVIEVSAVVLTLLLGGLVLPLLLKHMGGAAQANNQFIVGPMINCALIYAGIRFRGFFKSATIIFLPSILALTGIMAFAVGNIYALYMIPAIWIGNVILFFAFKYLYAKKRANYITTAVVAITAKAAIIFGGFLLLGAIGAIPAPAAASTSPMWYAMGIFQLVTATIGAVAAYAALRIVKVNK